MIMSNSGQQVSNFRPGAGPADRFYSRRVHLTPDRSPHALGSRGQLDMLDIQGIADRVRHRRERGRGAAFAAAAQPERVGGEGISLISVLKNGNWSARGMA